MSNTLLLEHLRSQARSAYRWTSFDPDKRGDRVISTYSELLHEDIELLKSLESTEEWIATYKKIFEDKFRIWLSAASRCASSAVTGPAKFPVRRAEKANEMERRRHEEFMKWRDKSLLSSKKFKRDKDNPKPVSDKENKEFQFTGFKVIINYEINRVQIQHEEKPSQELIDGFKKRGYKWSPRYKVWQRQLTVNALHATELILSIKIPMENHKTIINN